MPGAGGAQKRTGGCIHGENPGGLLGGGGGGAQPHRHGELVLAEVEVRMQ